MKRASEVIGECQPRHRHQEFLRFLSRIDQSIDPDLDVHLVLDNYRAHKHPDVKKWLAARPRYQVHFTPTSSSWLNQVERLVRGDHPQENPPRHLSQCRELIKAIHDYIRIYKQQRASFSVGRKRQPHHPKGQQI